MMLVQRLGLRIMEPSPDKSLRKYLSEIETMELTKEARRQSLLATRFDKEYEEDWEEMQDTSGWH